MALPKKTSYLMGGTYNSDLIVLTDGDLSPLQVDVNGNLKVTAIAGGGASFNPAAGPTGAPVPADADYQGINIGGILMGVTGLALGATTKAPTVAIVDASGNQITSFGGGTQYATGTVVATPTGTAALGWDGSAVRVLSTDTAGQLKVLIQNTPAVTVSGNVNVTQGTSPWVVSLASTTITGNVNVVGITTDGTTTETNFLVVGGESNDATAQYQPIPLGTTGRSVIIEGVAGGTAVPISGMVAVSGTVAVTQSTSPWVISFTAPQHVIVDSGSISVTQGTSPWVVSLTSTTITGNVNVVGTTTDGTTTETNFLVVGGESNDATAQYQPIPLGTTGRSVIIEGVAGGTAVPISGSISFSAPQHVIVDSGTISVTQGTSPWVVSLTSTTITGNVNVVGTTTDGTTTETNFLVVGGESNDATAQYQPIPLGTGGRSVIVEGVAGGTAIPISGSVSITGSVSVTQGTSPWIVAGAKTPSDTFANPTDAEDAFALLGGWDATNSVWRRVQVDAGTGVLKVDIGSNGTVAITGNVNVTQGTSPWVVSLTSTTITGNVNVVGTTTDGTTTETNFLVVGGESNDVTAQYQPIPLGASGRSVIVEGVSGGTVVPISGTVTANQGTPNTLANAWPMEITDGTNGPAAIKPGSTFPSLSDAALVVTLSPNNQDTRGLTDLLQTLILETRAMRTALVYMITENGDVLDSDFNPQSQDFQPVN
jgi:hypothetical protein